MRGDRICCYTAVTGNYDRINEPKFITPGVDYIYFTDGNPVTGSVWKYRPIPDELRGLSPVKQQRVIKICPHKYLPDYDISVWIDGNIKVKGDLRDFIREYDLNETPLYTRIHPGRNCTYDEAAAIIRFGKDSAELVNKIVCRYRNENFPAHIGMAETCILLRAHNEKKCVMFDNAWATELLLNSHRDQLSFNYIAWKLRFTVGYMTNQFKINQNDYFEIKRHG